MWIPLLCQSKNQYFIFFSLSPKFHWLPPVLVMLTLTSPPPHISWTSLPVPHYVYNLDTIWILLIWTFVFSSLAWWWAVETAEWVSSVAVLIVFASIDDLRGSMAQVDRWFERFYVEMDFRLAWIAVNADQWQHQAQWPSRPASFPCSKDHMNRHPKWIVRSDVDRWQRHAQPLRSDHMDHYHEWMSMATSCSTGFSSGLPLYLPYSMYQTDGHHHWIVVRHESLRKWIDGASSQPPSHLTLVILLPSIPHLVAHSDWWFEWLTSPLSHPQHVSIVGTKKCVVATPLHHSLAQWHAWIGNLNARSIPWS